MRDGEFVALVGPSGCGKTTLLNLCSGWLSPDTGRVDRPARLRMVFQQDGLFPWLTVDENILLGLSQVADRDERRRRADALLELIGLTAFAADLSASAVGRHAAAGRAGARARRRDAAAADGRAVLVARLSVAPQDAAGAGADPARAAAHRRPRDPRHRGGGAARGPRAGAVGAAGARARRSRARDAAAARSRRIPRSCARCIGFSPCSVSNRTSKPDRRKGHERMSSPFVRWGAGALALVAVLAVLRLQPWQRSTVDDRRGIRRRRARDARRGVPARHLPSDVPGHRLRVEDEPRHALRVAALHRFSDGGGDA